MPDAALIAENIHKRFDDLEVLKGLSVAANEGDVISIIGSSGSGKSTFLRCINYLEIPDQGRIVVDGEEVIADGKPRLIRNPHVGLGIAVDLQKSDGSRTLMVPCIREADTLDFREGLASFLEKRPADFKQFRK